MIDYNSLRKSVVAGLSQYLDCPVIRSNQNAEPPPYPYVSYTITTPMSANNGTYSEYEDGTKRKPVTQTWSISVLAADDSESVNLACKAREWFDYVGKTYLNDNNVIVQSVGGVTNRDNFLTVEYEYKKGFDVVFWLFDTIEGVAEEDGYIEAAELGGINVDKPKTPDELNDMLGKRLNGEVL